MIYLGIKHRLPEGPEHGWSWYNYHGIASVDTSLLARPVEMVNTLCTQTEDLSLTVMIRTIGTYVCLEIETVLLEACSI
jgi:hypothetical protein